MIQRQQNWLGQQRVDSPHLRALESSACADFDLLVGMTMAGDRALVIRGLDLVTSGAISSPATSLQLNTANAIIFHPQASESGTIFSVLPGTAVEVLSGTNPNVIGSFTPSQVNFIGLDLRRLADDSTSDLVEFLDANTLLEVPRTVPLARTLSYRIIISTIDFTTNPNVLPIAKVTTDAVNVVTNIADARQMMFRLGSGGSVPDKQNSFVWAQNRDEGVNDGTGAVFAGGDKSVSSLKDSLDALMTRLWELGGGEYWYSATSDRDVKLALGQPVLISNGDNFDWNSGTSTLAWDGLSVLFANSTATYNTITAGTMVIADGYCIYVDINRLVNATVLTVPTAIPLSTLGSPTVPGSRFVIAWRRGTQLFTRTMPYEVGRQLKVASTAAGASGLGVVRIAVAAGDPSAPTVIPLDANGQMVYTNPNATRNAIVVTGNTSGSGVVGTGGTSDGYGVRGFGGATSGHGVRGDGASDSGVGVYGQGGTASATPGQGVAGFGGNASGGSGSAGADGAFLQGGAGDGAGVGGAGAYGIGGAAAGVGIKGLGGDTSGPGVTGTGGAPNGKGVYGAGTGTGVGVHGLGGAGSGGAPGVRGDGGGTNGQGVFGAGKGFGEGVWGVGDTTGEGVHGQGGVTNGIGVSANGGGTTGIGLYASCPSPTGKAVAVDSGEYAYYAARTKTYWVPASEFITQTYSLTPSEFFVDTGRVSSWIGKGAGVDVKLAAPIHLPVGAKLAGIKLRAASAAAGRHVFLYVYRHKEDGTITMLVNGYDLTIPSASPILDADGWSTIPGGSIDITTVLGDGFLEVAVKLIGYASDVVNFYGLQISYSITNLVPAS